MKSVTKRFRENINNARRYSPPIGSQIFNRKYFMFKTSKSIIMPKLDLFFELFIIMISITKGQQHRITYLRGSRDSGSYIGRRRSGSSVRMAGRCSERFRFGIHESVQRIWTVYDYVGGCGRGALHLFPPRGSSLCPSHHRPLPQDLSC